jgi:type I restriction enzyme S subunit
MNENIKTQVIAGLRVITPSSWSIKKFSEIIDVRDGTHNTPKYVSEGIPLVTSKNLKDGSIDFTDVSYISQKDHIEISKRSEVEVDDILLAMIGTIGNPVIVRPCQNFSIKNVALFKKSKSVIPEYLKHFLNSPIALHQLNFETRGGTQKFVSLKVLRNLKIPLPPIAEQKRIAAILDKADAVRRKRREAIRLTEELLRSVFLDMFGDPVTNPMGWDVVKLGSLINSGTVITYGIVQAGEKLEEGIPYIRTSDIKDGVIQEDDLLKTSSKIANKYKRSEVHENDLVISIRATVGTIAKVPATLDGANLTQGTAKISVGEKIDADYLLNFIRSQGCQHWISQQVKGATFREITLKRLREMPIAVPPREQQTIFCKSLKHIETQKQRQLVILQESEDLFNSLLQRAFTGNL